MAFTTHKSILDGINRDDENSWQRFYKFYTPLIRLAGKDFHVPEMYLDDLVQNVFITLASGRTIVLIRPGAVLYIFCGASSATRPGKCSGVYSGMKKRKHI